MMKVCLFALLCALVGTLGLLPHPAHAEDCPTAEFPPPTPLANDEPPASEATVDSDSGSPLAPTDGPAPESAPVEAAAPADVASAPAAPASGRRLTRNTGCCWPRDDCGWPLDDCGRKRGRLQIAVEGLFTWMEDMDGPVGLGTGGTPSLSWDPNAYDGEFGGRVTFRYRVRPNDLVEVRGAWYGESNASSSQFGAIGAATPAPAIIGPGPAVLENTSELSSLEANWRHELCCKGSSFWTVLVGVRYLKLDETAAIRGFTVGTTALVTASALSEVDSSLIAGQIGGAWRTLVSRRVEFGASLKGFVGSLQSDIDVSDVSIFTGGPHTSTSEDSRLGWGADFEVGILLHMNSVAAFTFGYQLLVLGDVSRANQALDFSRGASGAVQALQAEDTLLNHALFAGFQFAL